MATTISQEVYSSKSKRNQKLFNNPLLERLTRTHISVPVSIFIIVAAGLVYYGVSEGFISALHVSIAFFVGLLAFTWVEYATHRYIFHMVTSTKFRESIQYKFHGVHHDYPKDKFRLAMPPVVSVLIVIALFFLFRLVMGSWVFGFLPGFITGYALYLFVHYSVHAFRVPKNFLRILWIHHGIHHHKEHDRAFGVSSPLWDFIYRTMPRKS